MIIPINNNKLNKHKNNNNKNKNNSLIPSLIYLIENFHLSGFKT